MAPTAPDPPTCCQRCRRQLLLHRAGALRDAAARESEATLLRAAIWLEDRATRASDPALSLEAGLHFLVLAEHPEVLDQPGLPARYLRKADTWIAKAGELASLGTTAPTRRNPDTGAFGPAVQ